MFHCLSLRISENVINFKLGQVYAGAAQGKGQHSVSRENRSQPEVCDTSYSTSQNRRQIVLWSTMSFSAGPFSITKLRRRKIRSLSFSLSVCRGNVLLLSAGYAGVRLLDDAATQPHFHRRRLINMHLQFIQIFQWIEIKCCMHIVYMVSQYGL